MHFRVILTCLLACASVAQGQLTRAAFTDGSSDGLWGTADNWDIGAVPSMTNFAVVNSGRTTTIEAGAPAIGGVLVGNGPIEGTLLRITASLATGWLYVAHSGTAPIGNVLQTGGTVASTSSFTIAGSASTNATGEYTIEGGSLAFNGGTMALGTMGSGLFRIRGSSPVSVAGLGVEAGSGGVLEFELDARGVTPLLLSNNLAMDASSKFVVDGTAYEGFDGFFPLVQAGGQVTLPDTSRIELRGMDERHPSLATDANSIWLRLADQPSYSQLICSAVPDSRVTADWSNSVFAATREFTESGSAWYTAYNEEHVFGARLSSTYLQGSNSDPIRSWDMRVARGGTIFSLRTPALGETVPPQKHNNDDAPWVDEVWQQVVVSPKNTQESPYYLHQAGTYLRDPAQTKPFNPPSLASHLDPENRSFTVVSWPVHAHTGIYTDAGTTNDWRSYAILYTRYRDLGGGVIEATMGAFNYGPDTINWINMPWGGVRRTSTEHAFLAPPGGAVPTERVTTRFTEVDKTADQTGGWIGYSDATNGSTATLAYVFGSDHSPLASNQYAKSLLRYGYAGSTTPQTGETDWRNYFVTTLIRRYNLARGAGVWSRYYLMLSDNLADASATIAQRNLTAPELEPFVFTEENSPLLGYSVTESPSGPVATRNANTPDLWLYAHPVEGSFPLFEAVRGDGKRFITWNPYAIGTTGGAAYMVKPYDGSLSGLKLLGFSLPYSAVDPAQHTRISEILTPPGYIADGQDLAVRNNSHLQEWKSQAFGSSVPSESNMDTGDPDQDGLNNLQEYANASDPLSPTPAMLHGSSSVENNGAAFTFRRRSDAEARGLAYILEQTSELDGGTWTKVADDALSVAPLDDTTDLVTLQLDNPRQVFVRLRLRFEE